MVEIIFAIPEFSVPNQTVRLRGILSSLEEIETVVKRWEEMHSWENLLEIPMNAKLDAEIQFYRQIITFHHAHPLSPLTNTNDTATLYALQESHICGYIPFAYSGRIHYDRPNVMYVNLYGPNMTIRQLLFDGMLRFLAKNLIKFFGFSLGHHFGFPMTDVWELEVFYCRSSQRHAND
jgi:hypothetical protein